VFHTIDPAGTRRFDEAVRLLEQELAPPGGRPFVSGLILQIAARGFRWGTSDGN
jgi:hypothetical protein